MALKRLLLAAVLCCHVASCCVEDSTASSGQSCRESKSGPPHHVRVLFWTQMWTQWHPEYEAALPGHAGVTCHFTPHRNELQQSHVVVFHFVDLALRGHPESDYVPPVHPPWQKWVYFSQESPAWQLEWRPKVEALFADQINAIATFQHDADIDARYGYFVQRTATDPLPDMNYALGRSKLAVWLVSNCVFDKAGRRQYVEEMQKHMAVDVFGECGQKIPQCSSYYQIDGCFSHLSREYKFYVAFENSDCDDYITEKLWRNSFLYQLVPIVRGKRNHYAQLAPPGSYIWADEFASPRDLANHVLTVSRDDKLYNDFFRWKSSFELRVSPIFSSPVLDDFRELDLRLCRYAREHWAERKTYNLSDIFSEQSRCTG